MNENTGRLRELKEDEPARVDEVEITIGDIIEIKGVPCKLVNVNTGKKRLTFTPIGRVKSVVDAAPKIAFQPALKRKL